MKRRTLLLGGSALAVAGAVAAAGGAAWKLRLFAKHYPPTPFDDVLGRIPDREWAEKFGGQALAAMPDFAPAAAAARLRLLLGAGNLEAAALHDVEAGRLTEAGNWVVPESVALIAALAASTK
jgi:hypothetical protein